MICKCEVCGKEFESEKNKRFCSSSCSGKFGRAKQLNVDINYVKEKEYSTCLYCGKTFEKRARTNKDKNWYCSRECADKSKVKPKQVKEKVLYKLICKHCGKEFESETKRKYCSNICRDKEADIKDRVNNIINHYKKMKVNICEHCGIEFPIMFRGSDKYCSTKCNRRAMRNRCKETIKDNAHRRRARKKNNGKVEKIYRKKVFERDNWTCKICGAKVDKEMIWVHGSLNSYYPTLDHIIPLSKGGEHTYENVQTACFICNSKKSDSI